MAVQGVIHVPSTDTSRQGFSVSWWKDKHNMHHAAPNEASERGLCAAHSPLTPTQLDHAANAVDPDIDTLPLLAWSTDMLQARFHSVLRNRPSLTSSSHRR